mgnify:CR=1 FL=1
MILVHGTCVDVAGTAVLLRGASGSGKSDLALRLIDEGARLIADDQVALAKVAGVLVAAAPPVIAGRIEARGVGLVEVPAAAEARLGLVIDLVAPAAVERLPQPAQTEIDGVALPRLALAPFEASATAKVRLAVRALRAGTLGTP